MKTLLPKLVFIVLKKVCSQLVDLQEKKLQGDWVFSSFNYNFSATNFNARIYDKETSMSLANIK